MTGSWKTLNNSPVCEYKTFKSGKVGHVYEVDQIFKAFWDGIHLGNHGIREDARLAIELLSGDHAPAPTPTYRDVRDISGTRQ